MNKELNYKPKIKFFNLAKEANVVGLIRKKKKVNVK